MTGKERALATIRQRRKQAEEESRLILQRLREDEKFDDLYRASGALKWDYVKAKTEEEKAVLSGKIEEAEKEVIAYLEKKGLPKDGLKAPYACKTCEDTGSADGKECACVERMRREIMLAENPLLKGAPQGLEKVDLSFYREEKGKKEKVVEAIEKGLSGGRKYFLLAGTAGTGKTYVAAAAVKGLLFSGKDVLCLSMIQLNKLFLEYHCAPTERKRELWRKFEEADVLFIDDLGAEQALNNVTIPYLLELLSERTDKITFLTTNLSPVDLEKRYGQRILSRLLDKRLSTPLLLDGKDLRF